MHCLSDLMIVTLKCFIEKNKAYLVHSFCITHTWITFKHTYSLNIQQLAKIPTPLPRLAARASAHAQATGSHHACVMLESSCVAHKTFKIHNYTYISMMAHAGPVNMWPSECLCLCVYASWVYMHKLRLSRFKKMTDVTQATPQWSELVD